jgi:hypothetical protein
MHANKSQTANAWSVGQEKVKRQAKAALAKEQKNL